MLKVQLFGPGRVQFGDQALPGFPTQQSHWLLCYLILHRAHPQTRERVAATFWGDLPGQAARKSLRNAMWRLRQSLSAAGADPDAYLSADNGSLSMHLGGSDWLDVEIFEQAVAACRDVPGESLSAEQAARLEAAVGLYSGDLLDGIYEDWCLHERERLRLLHVAALQRLMAYHTARGASEAGLRCGQAILGHDITREIVHRQMMRLYWLAGDRDAALAQYRRCAQILRDEIGASPMDETVDLYEQMVSGRYRPGRGAAEDAAPAPADRRAAPDQAAARQAMQRLRRLQSVLDETRSELNQLERLLVAALSGA